MASSKKQLVVFDFDWSMADQDSDRWLFEVLAPDLRRKMRDRSREPGKTLQWTDIHPAMKRGIQLLKNPTSLDTTLFILSNANTFFINTILQHQGIRDCFETIITNPADFSDPEKPNRLVLRRRVGPDDLPHGCQVGCEENMCKGQELTRYLDAHRQPDNTEFDRIIYVGDGSNDFCPVLRLRRQDVVLCRRFRGLERKIADERAKGDASRLQCTVEYWSGAWEVEEKFKAYAQGSSLGVVN
ncbi:putative phosphatase-domain-containing protein [Boletus edulis]|nr:putative phosphatase-domain-containing protein [Boletus edulis]